MSRLNRLNGLNRPSGPSGPLGTLRRRLAQSRSARDRGMSLAELIAVIAIGSIVMGLSVTVTVSLLKHHGANLVRQERTDGVRQVSIWLGDALTYATEPEDYYPGDPISAFHKAEANQMTFTSALPVAGQPSDGAVSRVTVVLGAGCPWTSGDPEPGVLRRCVQAPKIVAGAKPEMCTYGDSDCPDDLFDDFVVARGVEDGSLFSYYVGDAPDPVDSVPAADLPGITAVEMFVTVADDPDKPASGLATQATIFKRFSISEWRRM
ncbi:MAG: prepilin-type N-terminal cleavage/methylation domain-containing protein [Bifidobacteriaceae bacterium]|jgi:prepilin-type N-terminal cleavage/methylation domain-containing protein|nr:prepilin-type N-terminal cleavage/methylation domain-containing protein [Bifidobacteriaceae bacterium]